MKWVKFAGFILVVTLLQASLVESIAVDNIKPDLLLIVLVFFAISLNTKEAIITSFTIGFAADIIGSSMGVQMLSFGLFGTLLAYLHRVITIRKMPHQSLAIFVMAIVTGGVAGLLTKLIRQPVGPNICITILGTGVYSGLIGPFLFLPSAWWMGIKTYRFGRR